jgi:hypothetical protein
MSIEAHHSESKLKIFWLKYEQKVIIIAGILIISAIAYEAGFIQGRKNQQDPVIINKVSSSDISTDAEKKIADPAQGSQHKNPSPDANASASANTSAPESDNQKCAFVASKSSNKYHLPTCQFAKKIKPENKICFSSKEEAEKRGYQGAKCCIK